MRKLIAVLSVMIRGTTGCDGDLGQGEALVEDGTA
jgi:hypothetical protein